MRLALAVAVAACGAPATPAPVLANRGGVADTRPGEIEGEITDAKTGEPLAGATIVLMRGGETLGTQITDAEGYYRLRDLARDRYILAIYYADATVKLAGVAVEAGHSTAADWKLDQAASGDVVSATWQPSPPKSHHAPKLSAGHGAIVGVVTTKREHVPLRGLGIILRRGDGVAVTAATDHRGDFFFDDLVPGDYVAIFTMGDSSTGVIGTLGTLHVTAGQITAADLTIDQPKEDRD